MDIELDNFYIYLTLVIIFPIRKKASVLAKYMKRFGMERLTDLRIYYICRGECDLVATHLVNNTPIYMSFMIDTGLPCRSKCRVFMVGTKETSHRNESKTSQFLTVSEPNQM